jgi:uncharacterized RDD family membrane protein YckC
MIDAESTPIASASAWLRLAGFVLDFVGVFASGLAFGLVIGLISPVNGAAALEEVPDTLLGSILVVTYYVVLEGMFSRTLGKWIVGTRVVDERGERPTIGQILGRTACRFIPFEAFTFLGHAPRGWHDRFPGTYVIKTREVPASS